VDVSPLNRRTIDSYSAVDDRFHDEWGAEGDATRRFFLNPAIFRLLGHTRAKRILDAGCGNGYLSRLLARAGARVTGVEPASGPLAYAEGREAAEPFGIDYLQRDLSRLGDVGGPFDAVVANMVLMDIADWRPALSACVGALTDGGTFVYSLTHPLWISGRGDEWIRKGHVEIAEYLNEYESRQGVGVYYHRPLSTYLNETIRLGCEVVEVVEPRLAPDQVVVPEHELWTRIPSVVVVAAVRHDRSRG
jgi:SAM-dependent methyltransferase